jgi:hypothetical protein
MIGRTFFFGLMTIISVFANSESIVTSADGSVSPGSALKLKVCFKLLNCCYDFIISTGTDEDLWRLEG